jgi:non-canonical (house-cleaning) NTP pyrophosphatase
MTTVLITIKGGIVQAVAATNAIELAVYDMDTKATGRDALSSTFDEVDVISSSLMSQELRRIQDEVAEAKETKQQDGAIREAAWKKGKVKP